MCILYYVTHNILSLKNKKIALIETTAINVYNVLHYDIKIANVHYM